MRAWRWRRARDRRSDMDERADGATGNGHEEEARRILADSLAHTQASRTTNGCARALILSAILPNDALIAVPLALPLAGGTPY